MTGGILSLPDWEAGLGTGTADLAVAGTGLAVPSGVEARFEYNGLYLNMREWIDTILVNSIDGLHDADVRDSREVNPAAHGETAFNSFYGGRTIVLNGRIRAFSLNKMRDLQVALRAAFNDISQERPLIFHNRIDSNRSFKIDCKKSQPIAMGEAQGNFKYERDFQVTLRASNPRFTALLSQSQTIPQANFGSSVTLMNAGNFRAQPFITLTGPMTFPVITNETTDEVFTFKNVPIISAGDSYFIDVAKRRVYDAAGVNQFSKIFVSLTDWIELAPGDNILNITATGTTSASTMTVTWHNTYM